MEIDSDKSVVESLYKNTIEDCKILYNRSLGWECGIGWFRELSKLSYEMESLNLLYFPKYRVKIVAEQVKEKFGTLRFYYSVVTFQSRFVTFVGDAVEWLTAKLKNTKITFEYIKKKPEKTIMMFSMSELGDDVIKTGFISKSKTILLDDKEYVAVSSKYFDPGKFVKKPKNHKILFHLTSFLDNVLRNVRRLESFFNFHPSGQEAAYVYLFEKCSSMVKECEERLYETCELCGRKIDDSTRCTTKGWISFICEECAKKSNSEYTVGERKTTNGK